VDSKKDMEDVMNGGGRKGRKEEGEGKGMEHKSAGEGRFER
jgi:hypothetical protein